MCPIATSFDVFTIKITQYLEVRYTPYFPPPPHVALEPAYSNVCGPLPEKGWTPMG